MQPTELDVGGNGKCERADPKVLFSKYKYHTMAG